MSEDPIPNLKPVPEGYLSALQSLLSLPRETVPRLTADAAREAMAWAAGRLGLELVEIEGSAPSFLLLPRAGAEPEVTLLASWHMESSPVTPAALEGAERLALAATLAALGAVAEGSARTSRGVDAGARPPTVAVAVVPATSNGSLVLRETLSAHRARLRAPAAFWPRITAAAPARRRIFLGARGRVVLGVWGGSANPHRIRDEVVATLRGEAYGPRPLDFELLRKLAQSRDALDFLEETIDDPGAVTGEGEERLTEALFAPRGQVLAPSVRHPDRPQAWLIFDTAENMEAAEIKARVEALASGARIEMAEAFPWDRLNIHHPSIRALVALAKSRSAGPEIWPMAPWSTPSGVFSRALGVPLAEWGVPLPRGGTVRSPGPDVFAALGAEIAELLLRATGSLPRSE